MKKEELIKNLENIDFNLSHSSSNLLGLSELGKSIISFITDNYNITLDEDLMFNAFGSYFNYLDNNGLSFLYKSKKKDIVLEEDKINVIYEFLGFLSAGINIEVTSLLKTYQNKLDFLNKLNAEEAKERLDLVNEIYANKNEQDRKNKESQKLELTNRLKEMSEDALSKVKFHTRIILILFLSLLLIPVALENVGFFKTLKEVISDYFLYALVYIPIMLFIWYFIQQRSYAVKIATDYEFKLNYFNIFLYGHNWIDAKIENKEMQDKAYTELINNLIAILADNPTRLYEKEPKGLPVDEVISLIKEVKNEISK